MARHYIHETKSEVKTAWRIVTRAGDYTVICTETEIQEFQREYIARMRAAGVALADIQFTWDRTRIVPLTGVR